MMPTGCRNVKIAITQSLRMLRRPGFTQKKNEQACCITFSNGPAPIPSPCGYFSNVLLSSSVPCGEQPSTRLSTHTGRYAMPSRPIPICAQEKEQWALPAPLVLQVLLLLQTVPAPVKKMLPGIKLPQHF
jgi:hypothetical protein